MIWYILGYYALFGTTKHAIYTENAILKSALLPAVTGSGKCFSFWYYMYGASVDTLSVLFKYQTSPDTEIMWQLIGSQQKSWLNGRVPITSTGDYQVYTNILTML